MPHSSSNSGPRTGRPPVLATVDGQWINIAAQTDMIAEVRRDFRLQRGFSIHVLNLDHLVKRRRDPLYKDAYDRATYVTCDGAPVAALARRQFTRMQRTPGPDLIEPLCALAAEERMPVYLFGSDGEALRRAAEQLTARCPGIDICGTDAPSRNFDPTSAEADAAIDRIAASGARLCLIALGSPKQEVMSRRALDRHPHLGLLNIGAGMDFIGGSQMRAPKIVKEHGLEWLWRLATNPRRLSGRYARCAVLLADVAIANPVRRRFERAVSSAGGGERR
jgi:exopolysaccharide biosynthesis WecB/TagA/CpsF family protein